MDGVSTRRRGCCIVGSESHRIGTEREKGNPPTRTSALMSTLTRWRKRKDTDGEESRQHKDVKNYTAATPCITAPPLPLPTPSS